MTDVRCDWCGVVFNKTPAKIKKDKYHFHVNECRLKHQRVFGVNRKKPDHRLYKSLMRAGREYSRTHPKSDWDALNRRL